MTTNELAKMKSEFQWWVQDHMPWDGDRKGVAPYSEAERHVEVLWPAVEAQIFPKRKPKK